MQSTSAPRTVEIIGGDTLWVLSRKYGVMPSAFSIYVPTVIKTMDALLMCKTLKEIHFCTYPLRQPSLYAILFSLQNLPAVEELCLSLETYKEFYDGDEMKRSRLCRPTYTSLLYEISHVKTITINEFTGDNHEIDVGCFVLGTAVLLESLRLRPQKGKQVNEKLIEQLLQVPRASTSAQVVCLQALDEDDDLCPRQSTIWAK